MKLRALFPALVVALAACPAADDGDDDGADSAPTTAADADGGPATSAADDDGGATVDDTAAADDGGGLQATWGAPCTDNTECVALLGDGAECLNLAVAYELPGGYCSKPCTLPDDNATVLLDAPECDPNGGVHCIGQALVGFEYCAPPCMNTSECGREGYECRQMPMIAQAEDPMFCLMPDCCLSDCSDC